VAEEAVSVKGELTCPPLDGLVMAMPNAGAVDPTTNSSE
jgi:hypothetical protein